MEQSREVFSQKFVSASCRNAVAKAGAALLGACLAFSAVAAEIGPLTGNDRAKAAFKLRKALAEKNYQTPLPDHPDNGDDVRYPDRMNSFTKGLPHDNNGIVSPAAYNALLHALTSGANSDFEAIPMGVVGGSKLRNPQAAYTFYLEGGDTHAFGMRAAPLFSSAEQASESIEVLWQALTRDVPFSQYETHPLIQEVVADMNRFSDFRGPREGGQVTARSLFRGIGVGELNGPYISQFLLKPVPYGATTLTQKYNVPVAGNDHMTNYGEWLLIQRGGRPSGLTRETLDPTPRYVRNGRDLAQYVLKDFNAQAYLAAAQILNSFGAAAISDTNPYRASATQAEGPLWGVNHAMDMLSRVAMSSQSQAWHQKWLVHRRARPEVFFGRVHNHLSGVASYPIHAELFASPALMRTFANNGTYLLPMATPSGSPLHPSYPAGHATMAGAAATVLKAFYKGSFVIPSPVVPSDDGLALMPYTGPALTVEGELNKLASNISLGRDTAGVHFRTDGDEGMRLGEELAIRVLQDLVNTYNEAAEFRFNRFDGTPVVITKQALN